jgi:hypothetical protein
MPVSVTPPVSSAAGISPKVAVGTLVGVAVAIVVWVVATVTHTAPPIYVVALIPAIAGGLGGYVTRDPLRG